MPPSEHRALAEFVAAAGRDGEVWPGAWYEAQLARLRAGIGQRVYLIEIHESDIHLAVQLNDKPLELLAVVNFPKPDPARHLLPHLIVLSDGRGLNLGRVTRISIGQPFQPAPEEVLYQNAPLHRAMLGGERTLTRERISAISRMNLAELLAGTTIAPRITAESDAAPAGEEAVPQPRDAR